MDATDVARGEELVAFLHADVSGMNRGRSVPVSQLEKRLATGVGWVPADQALTALGPIAEPNPWGSLGDLRLLPGRDTEVRVDLWEGASPLHFFLCDATNTDGSPWDSCPRTLLGEALARLEREAGLRLISSFEQEFFLEGVPEEPVPSFTLEAQRLVDPFGPLLMSALRQANLEPEFFLPEYGSGQYEAPCAPAEGVAAADRASSMREVTREVARWCGYRASFTPKVAPVGVGNGVHIHMSAIDADGRPAFHDPARPGGLSVTGARFAAGILEHLPALCAFTAPSVVSYLRLIPHHWSASFGCLGEHNRETAIRLPSLVELAKGDAADHQFNLEFRAADSAACPHLALAVLVLAGLHGLQEELVERPVVKGDPSRLDGDERRRLGISPLPSSLGDALEALEADAVIRSWFSQDLWECYLSVKRTEMALLDGSEPKEVCERYLRVY